MSIRTYVIKAQKDGEKVIEQIEETVDKTNKKGGNNVIIIIAIAVIIILAIVFGIFFFLYKKEKSVNKVVDNSKTTVLGVDEDKK